MHLLNPFHSLIQQRPIPFLHLSAILPRHFEHSPGEEQLGERVGLVDLVGQLEQGALGLGGKALGL